MIGKIVGEGKKTRYFIDGKQVTKREFVKAFPDKPIRHGDRLGTETDWRRAVESYGAACHPKRIKEFETYMAKNGVPTDFTTLRGRPRFVNRSHQIAALKLLKLHNKDETKG